MLALVDVTVPPAFLHVAPPVASEVKTFPAPAPFGIVSVALIVAAPVVVKAVRVDVPVTANVPPSEVAPFPTVNVLPAATVTLSFNAVVPFAVKVPVIVAAPPTFKVEDKTNEVPVAAPITGFTKVGALANTNAPEPVSSVIVDIKFALVGVAKNDAIPVPKPLTPVAIGKPVALVKVTLEGIPKFGVVKIGLVNVLFINVSVPAIVANVPVAPGSVIVVEPATAGAITFAVPEVEPL